MTTRKVTAVAVALVTAAALSACTPPGEKAAGQHVDTATTGPATPSIYSTAVPAAGTADATATTDAETGLQSGAEIVLFDEGTGAISTDSVTPTATLAPNSLTNGVAATNYQPGTATTDTAR